MDLELVDPLAAFALNSREIEHLKKSLIRFHESDFANGTFLLCSIVEKISRKFATNK